jgi:hypothetical protein
LGVDLEFDWVVEAGFYYLGSWPVALIDAIGAKKVEMFDALRPNPLAPNTLIAAGSFFVEGSVYEVIFGCDRDGHRARVMRVMGIRP